MWGRSVRECVRIVKDLPYGIDQKLDKRNELAMNKS